MADAAQDPSNGHETLKLNFFWHNVVTLRLIVASFSHSVKFATQLPVKLHLNGLYKGQPVELLRQKMLSETHVPSQHFISLDSLHWDHS